MKQMESMLKHNCGTRPANKGSEAYKSHTTKVIFNLTEIPMQSFSALA